MILLKKTLIIRQKTMNIERLYIKCYRVLFTLLTMEIFFGLEYRFAILSVRKCIRYHHAMFEIIG